MNYISYLKTNFYNTNYVTNHIFDIEREKDKHNRIFVVHRLDKDTSGLMLVAKNEFTLEKLSEMISKKEVERKYSRPSKLYKFSMFILIKFYLV